MESIRVVIANNIKRLIGESDLKQVQIAREARVSPQTIQRWMKGEHPPDIENLEKLAKILNVDVWEFYKTETEVKKLLTIGDFIKMMSSIPEDVYELAGQVSTQDPQWDTVRSALEVAIERNQELQKKTNHS